MANETIAIPVEATSVGALAPAARAGYGGILLFGTTAPASMPQILATLQRERPGRYAWMVMTDEEGGGVERLTNLVGSFPWAQTMGKNLTAAHITAIAQRVGTALSAAGVNTDLAPVLDVDARAQYPGAANPDGYRSFSGVPSIAATDGTAFMKGLQQAGVLSVVKHFPGLGYSTRNTDYGPAATLSWAKLQTTGLVPFRQAIADGASAVMMSNARVPGLTPLPAGLSSGRRRVPTRDARFQGSHRHRLALRGRHQRAAPRRTGGVGAGPRGRRRPDPLRFADLGRRVVGVGRPDLDGHRQRGHEGHPGPVDLGRRRGAGPGGAQSC